jgi:hypothetical protein
MTEPTITPELVAKHNLTPEKFARAKASKNQINNRIAFCAK